MKDEASAPLAGSAAPAESILETIDRLCAVVPNYPTPGVTFRDLTPVFADGPALRGMVDALLAEFEGSFDYVAGVEARGFLLAAAAAYASGHGVITVRKPGKLPRPTYSETYSMEYGTNSLEVHIGDIPPAPVSWSLTMSWPPAAPWAPPPGSSNGPVPASPASASYWNSTDLAAAKTWPVITSTRCARTNLLPPGSPPIGRTLDRAYKMCRCGVNLTVCLCEREREHA